jgi:basic membrane lipoprotein Med (substrate-binding protein (PBP1-ABC) superfamily)
MKHHMFKVLALVCALILLTVSAMAEGLDICILSSTGVDDGSFIQDCYTGILDFIATHDDCNVTDIKEPDYAQLIPTVEKLAGDYDVFVLPSHHYATIGDVVINNPDTYFIVVDTPIQDGDGNPVTANNVYTMTFKEQEGGFFSGVAAALSTKSGKVAVVNGMPSPPTSTMNTASWRASTMPMPITAALPSASSCLPTPARICTATMLAATTWATSATKPPARS